MFKHALIQDAAYASLLRSRRQQVHRQVAQQLEAMFPDMVETQPELVAHHYTAAGLGEPAVIYWQRAGDLANRRSAYPEAIAHVSQGLAVLETLPETPTRVDQEIRLRLALGRPLMAAHGIAAPQVGETYTRLRQLCAHGKDLALRFAALRGLRVFYTGRAEHHRAVEVSAEALRVAQQTNDPMLLAEGHLNAGVPHLYLGQLHRAIDHFTQGIVRPGTVSQPISGAALDVICRSHISIALWLLGYPDQAQQRHHEALTISQQRPDVFTQGMAQLQSLLYLALCREWPALHDQSVGLDEFATVGCLPQMKGIAAIMLGWYRAVRERDPDGIVQLHQGIEMFRNTAGDVFHPSWLARLAEAYAQIGKPEEALNTVAKAFEVMKAIDEYVHHAELCWIKGTMLRSYPKDRTEEAETCFHQSRNIARQQQAKSWELRAATSLTRLWQNQSKRQEAYDLLAPVYGWFTEGFDTADLKEAKTLLAELGRSSNPSA
jgi:predicted ATPase